MNSIIARYDLPDTWAGKGACPVCRVRGRLQAAHQAVTPDQLSCAACDAAFEVEIGGAHVRLVRLPTAGTAADPDQLLEQWLLPSELAALLAAAQAAAEPAPPAEQAPATAPQPPSKHALKETVRELLYGSDEADAPAAPAQPASSAATAAETLLANLRSDVPAVAPRPMTAPLPPLPADTQGAETEAAEEPAALLSALLADLPAAPAPVDEAAFLDTLAAQAGATAPAETPPGEPGDAAALLARSCWMKYQRLSQPTRRPFLTRWRPGTKRR